MSETTSQQPRTDLAPTWNPAEVEGVLYQRWVDAGMSGLRIFTTGTTMPGQASWLLLEFAEKHANDPRPGAVQGKRAEHRLVPFDVDAVVRDLRARLHPNTEFLEATLTGKRPQIREPRGQ